MLRRSFIKGGLLAGVGAIGAAGYLGTRKNSELPSPTQPLYVLDEIAFGVLVHFARRIVPLEPADPKWIAHTVDHGLQYATPEAQADLQLVLAVLENSLSGVFTRFNATLFSELDADAGYIAITRWGNSPVAMLAGATASLRKLCLGSFYGPIENAMAIGYPGPPFDKPEPEPISARKALSKPYQPKSRTEEGSKP